MESQKKPFQPIHLCSKFAPRLIFFCFDTTVAPETSSRDVVLFRIGRLVEKADTYLVDPTTPPERKVIFISPVLWSEIRIPRSELGSEVEFLRAITPHVHGDRSIEPRWRARMIKELTSAAHRCLEQPGIGRCEVCLRTRTLMKRSENDEYFELARGVMREVYLLRPELEPASLKSLQGLKTASEEELDTMRDDCCPICTGGYLSSPEATVAMPCSHKNCITQWLDLNHVCPMCRFEMPHHEIYHDPEVFECRDGVELSCHLLPYGGSSSI